MTTINWDIQEKIEHLRDAAFGGLPSTLATFILRTTSMVYAAPNTFASTQELSDYLDALTDLINVKVNSR